MRTVRGVPWPHFGVRVEVSTRADVPAARLVGDVRVNAELQAPRMHVLRKVLRRGLVMATVSRKWYRLQDMRRTAMPLGNRSGSAWMVPSAARSDAVQQSSVRTVPCHAGAHRRRHGMQTLVPMLTYL